jgi:uncharacterized protein YycO
VELTLLYCRSWTVAGVLIRLSQWFGRYSHVAVLTPQGTVIDARAFTGVRETPFDEWIKDYSSVDAVTASCPRPDLALEFLRRRVGDGYDYRGLLNFVLRRVGHDRMRWNCVELAETAMSVGGRSRFRVPLHRVTPHQSHMTI